MPQKEEPTLLMHLRLQTGKTNATSASGYITLVDETSDIIPAQTQITDDAPVTPQMIAIALAIIIIGTTGRECIKKKNYWWFDAILLVLTGLPGLILFAMIFSVLCHR